MRGYVVEIIESNVGGVVRVAGGGRVSLHEGKVGNILKTTSTP